MTERPILFSAPMVRALLAGTKTQTRRVVKLPHMNPLGQWQPTRFGGPNGGLLSDGSTIPEQGGIWHTRTGDSLGCPYGQPGDRLWVREAWAAPHAFDHLPPRLIPDDARFRYAASEAFGGLIGRPSIHMPRWASRITLKITGVRVERLQAISEADAMAEGIGDFLSGENSARSAFADLWESINGPGSWDANPWVWVVEFKRMEAGNA